MSTMKCTALLNCAALSRARSGWYDVRPSAWAASGWSRARYAHERTRVRFGLSAPSSCSSIAIARSLVLDGAPPAGSVKKNFH